MSIVFGNTVPMSSKALDFLWKKQQVTMENIANVDTPGYKSRYVTFEEAFSSKLKAASMSNKPDAVSGAIGRASYTIHSTRGESARLDENNVQMDVEQAELARTTLQYQFLSDAITSDVARYRTAIKGN